MTDPLHEVEALLAEWEKERPEGFLKHATVATSQYDAQYRSMSKEILTLREARRALSADFQRLREENEMYHAQFRSVGIAPYLDRMKELARRAEAAESQVQQLQEAIRSRAGGQAHQEEDKG